MHSKVNIVILAAGLGTRMKSKHAKVLHRAGGVTLAEHAVATASAITEPEWITVVTGYQRHVVEAALFHTGVKFVEQAEQKGTGHALMMCRAGLEERGGLVAVTYGDAPLLSAATLRRLIETQAASGAAATVLAMRLEDPTGYGRVIVDARGHVTAIVEQKNASPEQRNIRLVNSGIYCFEADLLWRHIGEVKPNPVTNEYYLTDLAEILTAAGHWVGVVETDDPRELLGINNRLELAEADRAFRDRKVRELMLSGVTIEKPETVSIDQQALVGSDTVIEPYTRILGRTVIGQDCRIGASSILENTTLGDGVNIGPMTIVADSDVDAGAHIGPFARLRMQNRVGAGVHIGNFVELKKTRMGQGAKANHLAYLGDSDIGGKANIGAGTITCNFDGVDKHPTKIGERAFIGSNSTLVAPVEVGEDGYVGAGSVITDTVPPGALALGRERQLNKEGWVEKKRRARNLVHKVK